MTLLQKLIWFFIIFFISYILLIFNSPTIAWAIEKVLWIGWFNNFVLKFKWAYDTTVTNIPTKDELKNAYDIAHSWAIEFWENFKMWAEFTKDKIDWYRETLSWAEWTYNEVKDWYNEIKDYVNTNSWMIDEIRNTIETFSWITDSLSNTWTFDWITDTLDRVVEIKDELVWTGEIE